MSHLRRIGTTLVVGAAVLAVTSTERLGAQITTNPYRAVYGWEKIPASRGKLGVDRRHLHRP